MSVHWRFVAACLIAWVGEANMVTASGQQTVSPGKERRVDASGDPLPARALFRLGTRRLRHNSGAITMLAFSEDGNRLISVNEGGEVQGWEVGTGREAFYRKEVAAGFRPKYLALNGEFGIGLGAEYEQMHSIKTGKLIRVIQKKPGSGWPRGRVSPEGRYFVTVQEDGLCCWDLTRGKLRRLVSPKVVGTDTYRVAVSKNARCIACTSFGRVVLVWTEQRGVTMKNVRVDPKGGFILATAISPDGRWLAICYLEVEEYVRLGDSGRCTGKIVIWDIASGKKRRIIHELYTTRLSLAFSPDGNILAFPHCSGGVALWNPQSGKQLRHLTGTNCFPTVFAFSPDGKRLAVGGQNRAVRIWDVTTEKELFANRGHRGRVVWAKFTPDGRSLISAAGREDDKSVLEPPIYFWEARSGKLLRQVTWAKLDVCFPHFERKHGWLGLVKKDGIVEGRHLLTGKFQRFVHPGEIVKQMTLSPNGQLLATVTQRSKGSKEGVDPGNRGSEGDATIHVWEMKTGKKRGRFPYKQLYDVKFSPKGMYLVCQTRFVPQPGKSAYAPTMQFWSTKTVTKSSTIKPVQHDVNIVVEGKFDSAEIEYRMQAFSQHRLWLYGWNIKTGKLLSRTPMSNLAESVHAHHRTGRFTVSSMYPRASSEFPKVVSVVLKEKASGQTMWTWTNEVRNLDQYTFSNNGRFLAIGKRTGEVVLFDMLLQKILSRFTGHRTAVETLTFSPDDCCLVSGSGDTTLLVWDIKSFHSERTAKSAVLSPKQLDDLWGLLIHIDAKKAWRAVAQFVSDPRQTVPFFRRKLQPVRGPGKEAIAQAILALDSRRYAVRTKAMAKVAAYAELAEPALRHALANKPTLEMHLRIQKILAHIRQIDRTPERLRQMRVLQTLEWIGDPNARRLLKTLATGHEKAWLTREARASLERLTLLKTRDKGEHSSAKEGR